jgi:hypothetical protein
MVPQQGPNHRLSNGRGHIERTNKSINAHAPHAGACFVPVTLAHEGVARVRAPIVSCAPVVASQRTAAGRYAQPSLFRLLEG